MLAKARRSACRPAPLVGSEAAKVRTAGREGAGSFMGGKQRALHLKSFPRCAREDAIDTIHRKRARPGILTKTDPHTRCLRPRLLQHRIKHGDASPVATSTTRPRGGPRTAYRPEHGGRISPPAGAARSAAHARTTSRWSRSERAQESARPSSEKSHEM